MKKQLVRGGKISYRIFEGIVLFVASYFCISAICSFIPVNTDYIKPADGITIAVISNGVHTDIVVPVKNELCDWTKTFSYTTVKKADSTYRYLSFGWGDKGFFINTPTWADLKASTAVNAMFWMSTSAMHVTWKKNIVAGPRCHIITINKENYLVLCQYIQLTFSPGNTNLPQHINAPGYGMNDAFYEAKGRYNLFHTCNVWTGNGLKKAGVRVALWTPFEKSVFRQLP
ncbi:MAG: TIGR02117 family protein [Bacteroidota bacterium]|nr:TIGR02117 family protein [Bacteroidota bacterium]